MGLDWESRKRTGGNEEESEDCDVEFDFDLLRRRFGGVWCDVML